MSSEGSTHFEDLDFGVTVRGLRAGDKLLQRYVLKRILGRGGMGVVWLAFDDVLEREIAFKFLPETVNHDKNALDELKRETRRSLELTHPNIIRIYDFVSDATCAGITMEYVDGSTLSNLRAEQPNKVFEVAELQLWVLQLCEALEYAHEEAELAHRDLKPANLMVSKTGKLKVADFGISGSVSNTLTRISMAHQGPSGTLVYMSPQQAMGDVPSVSDDIYAVGATVYELLTGKPPFYQGDIMTQLREKIPPTMAQRRKALELTGEGLQPIPRKWEDAIAECLAKDPAKRPQSARDLIDRLGLQGTKVVRRRAARSSKAAPAGDSEAARPEEAEAPGQRSKPARTKGESPSGVVKGDDPPAAPARRRGARGESPKAKTRGPLSKAKVDAEDEGDAGEAEPTEPSPAARPQTERGKSSATGGPLKFDLEVVPKTVGEPGASQLPTVAASTTPAPPGPPKPSQPASAAALPPGGPIKAPVETPAMPVVKKRNTALRLMIYGLLVVGAFYLWVIFRYLPADESSSSRARRPSSFDDLNLTKEMADARKTAAEERSKLLALQEKNKKLEDEAARLKEEEHNKALLAQAQRAEEEQKRIAAEKEAKTAKEAADKARTEAASKNSAEAEKARIEMEGKQKEAEQKAELARKEVEKAKLDAEKLALTDKKKLEEAQKQIEMAQAENARIKAEAEKKQKESEELARRLQAVADEKERLRTMRGTVMVQTIPPGAVARLGGQEHPTPCTFTDLPLSTNLVYISKEGYEPANFEVRVTDDPVVKKFSNNGYTNTLIRSTGRLAIHPVPDVADFELFIDDKTWTSGKTPIEISAIPTGNYVLKLSHAQFATTNQVAISRDKTANVVDALPYGYVAVESDPAGAKVLYKGIEIGAAPLNTEMGVGNFELEFQMDHFRPFKTNFTVAMQKTTKLKPKLQRTAGPNIGDTWTNSLGMKFVPVGDGHLLFCIWETRRRDFEKFADPRNGASYPLGKEWNDPFKREKDNPQGPSDPVIMVSWNDARAFCEWLTVYERKNNQLEDQIYRLPTDAEWSIAAGLPEEKGNTPEEKHNNKPKNIYPWGNQFPPPSWAGNYNDEYSYDRFDYTAPVGQFRANASGIYDLGGNVWEWCSDQFNPSERKYVLRGGSWQVITTEQLLAGYRLRESPDARELTIGFRCVLEVVPAGHH